MKGLQHEFSLLPDVGERKRQVRDSMGHPDAVVLHDDVLVYFRDTLNWLPTENPANPREWSGRGLNWYGPTAISGQGALMTARVFAAWADMFALGPKEFTLTGAWSVIEGDDAPGQYDKIAIKRDEVVSRCRAIADLARRAVEPQYWLLHIGV